MKFGRNEPCHCGSGKKYKKCCLARDTAARKPAPEQALSVASTIGHVRDRLPVIGVASDDELELAERDFADRGPARQMMDFAQPLIDQSDGSIDALNKALSIAMIFWNLAIMPEQEREQALVEIMAEMSVSESEGVQSAFQALAETMIERHRQMFPELHRG
jgi:SEC-C motif